MKKDHIYMHICAYISINTLYIYTYVYIYIISILALCMLHILVTVAICIHTLPNHALCDAPSGALYL